MQDQRLLKSYVWHGDQCFFVSTIERDCSSMMGGRYFETIAWKYEWETGYRGEQVSGTGSGPAFEQHFSVVAQLFRTGKVSDGDD